jgi:mannose-6-phosphate isomerase-like protein (cupin superfamily)
MHQAYGVHLPEISLNPTPSSPRDGNEVLRLLVAFAERAMAQFEVLRQTSDVSRPAAAVGRLRGRGPWASLTALVHLLERDLPREVAYPFEGSDRVGGAVWTAARTPRRPHPVSIAKLRWESRAIDLPMHVHDHSDRVIVVLEGRGFFHASSQAPDRFDGREVTTIAARERDVFLFARGTVHTFSTRESPMVLLSCQLPYLPFDDPRQYRLPATRWCAARLYDEATASAVVCGPAWEVIAVQSTTRRTDEVHPRTQ